MASACMMHPLMAGYGLGAGLLLTAVLSRSWKVRGWGTGGLGLTAVALGAVLQLSATPESEVYKKVVLTRDYWFLSQWHWYELIGLVAPLVILSVVAMGK